MGEGHRHAELVERVAEQEAGEASHDRHLATRRQARGDADHVALGNAAVKEAVRMILSEPFGAGRVAHIAIDDDNALILLAQVA